MDNYIQQKLGTFKVCGKPILPVAELLNNISNIMDQIDPLLKLRLQSYVRTDNFEPQFNYICSEYGMKDCAELENPISPHINLHENFCGMFWAFCYFVLYTYDELYAKQKCKKDFNGQLVFDKKNDFDALKLWLYGKDLQKEYPFLPTEYRYWPSSLPHPYIKEDFICAKANGLFTYGVTFILLHEMGHLIKRHFKRMQSGEITRLQAEQEADTFAINKIRSCFCKSIQGTANNGAILAFTLLCIWNWGANPDYPFPEDRVTNALLHMNLREEDITWMIAAYGLVIWFADIAKFQFPTPIYFNTPKDFYYSVLSLFKIVVDRP